MTTNSTTNPWHALGPVFAIRVSVLLILLLSCKPVEAAPQDRSHESRECTPFNGLIILTEFPDVPHHVERGFVNKRFFHQLDHYVREMSYGKHCVQGDITSRWIRLPDPVSRYRIAPRNLEVKKSRVKKLIQDTINEVDNEVDFARYDFTAIFLGAGLDDYGMIGLCGYPGMLGWSSTDTLETASGQRIKNGVAIFTYQAHLGTLFHDIAHVLGGVSGGKRNVPCLYDHDLQSRAGPLREVFVGSLINMGFWDPMSCHYIERRQPPRGISAWTRSRLGWLDQPRVRTVDPGQEVTMLLEPLEDAAAKISAIKIPLSESTYYLIENRQPIGFDRFLPGPGVLIMSADDRIAECRHGEAPVRLINADPGIPHLKGAAFNEGKTTRFVDSENGIEINLLKKIGRAYEILVKSSER